MAFPSRVIEETKCGLWYIHPTKKEEEFPGAFKIEQLRVEFLWSWFLTLEFPTVSHSFADFAGVKVCFLQNFSVINDHMLQCMIV